MLKSQRIPKIELILSAIGIFLFCFYFIPSPGHEIRIHDTFDGNFSTRHVLIHSGHFFDTDPTSIVPGIMNGLPRGVFPRFTEITSLLMYCFGSLGGFALTFILVRLLAFIGIYKLGKDHLGIQDPQNGPLILVATCFACLPFFIIHGLTVAGVPLVAWAFLNIYKKQKTALSYFTLLLFVLWSNFVLVGFHVLFCFGLLAIWLCIKDKQLHLRLFVALIFVAITYVLSDYMLFYMHLFNKAYHSSRGEMDKFLGLNVSGVVGGTFKTFVSGDYSTANYFGLIVLPLLFLAFVPAFRERKKRTNLLYLIFLAMLLFCCLFINLLDWNKFAFFYKQFPFAKEFNFKRFTSLAPGLFFILAVCAIAVLSVKKSNLIRAGTGLVFLVLFVTIWRGNISYNRSGFDTRGLRIFSDQQVTFDQFFDPPFYQKIVNAIGADTSLNVIHFGLSASPSKYAGLKVLDDYQGDYPREYKQQFRKVIEKELDKSEKLKAYFDNWGSRCYMESANSFGDALSQKDGFPAEPQLDIDTQQLKSMNCGYIISGIVIENASSLKLAEPKILVSERDHKTIFLYKLL